MLYGQELYRDALAPEAETRMTEQCNLQQMLDNQIFPPTTSSISQCLVRLAEVGIEAGDNPEEMLQKLQQKYGFDRQVLDATNRALTDSASLGSGSWDKRDYVVLFNTWADEVLTRYFSAETVEGIKADQREFLIELQDYHQTSADREALADTLFAYLAVAHLAMPAVAAGVAIAGKSPNQVQQPQN